MASYRPKIKKSDGSLVEIPLDAETFKGHDSSYYATKSDVNNYIPTAVKDIGNNNSITFSYSSGGLSTAAYYTCWNGYRLTYISKNDLKNDLGVNNCATKDELNNYVPKNVQDSDGTPLSFNYAHAGVSTASYYACWNGRQLSNISKDALKKDLGIGAGGSASSYEIKIINVTMTWNSYSQLNGSENVSFNLSKTVNNIIAIPICTSEDDAIETEQLFMSNVTTSGGTLRFYRKKGYDNHHTMYFKVLVVGY